MDQQDNFIRVTLTDAEIAIARFVADLRNRQAVKDGKRGKYRAPEGEEGEFLHVAGCVSELAVAKALNLFWSGSVGNYEAVDVGGIVEVRSTFGPNNRLMLHEGDRDEYPFVSTVISRETPEVTLRGWVFGKEGKSKTYWEDPSKKNRHAFFVPNNVLRPMQSLLEIVGGAS